MEPMSKPEQRSILTLCGSLREKSFNQSLLDAATGLFPADVGFEPVLGLELLPPFNPDLDQEGDEPPAPVTRLRDQFRRADGILLSTPEYVHGIPGVLKNAIDWLVSSGSFVKKPIVLVSVCAGDGQQVQEMLNHTLTVLEAVVIKQLSFHAGDLKKGLSEAGVLQDQAILDRLSSATELLVSNLGVTEAVV